MNIRFSLFSNNLRARPTARLVIFPQFTGRSRKRERETQGFKASRYGDLVNYPTFELNNVAREHRKDWGRPVEFLSKELRQPII